MKETVLITGANGNLGKKFLLSKSGFEVCALVRSKKAESDLINFITKNNPLYKFKIFSAGGQSSEVAILNR